MIHFLDRPVHRADVGLEAARMVAAGLAVLALFVTTYIASPPTFSADPKPPKQPQFLGSVPREPITVDLVDRSGRVLRGKMLGYEKRGFVLAPEDEAAFDVPWGSLRTEDFARLYGRLLPRHAQSAGLWLEFGERLLSREDGESFGRQAVETALRLDPKLQTRARAAVARAQMRQRNRQVSPPAAKSEAASPLQPANTWRVLKTPLAATVVTRQELRLRGEIAAYDDKGFDFLPVDGNSRFIEWQELGPHTVVSLHVKLFQADQRADPRDWFDLNLRLRAWSDGASAADRALEYARRLNPKLVAQWQVEQRNQAAPSTAPAKAPAPQAAEQPPERTEPAEDHTIQTPEGKEPAAPAGRQPWDAWKVRLEPPALAQLLREAVGEGEYLSDRMPLDHPPAPRLHKSSQERPLKSLRYEKGPRSREVLLASLAACDPAELGQYRSPLRREAVTLSLEGAADLAVRLAEANLRLCPPGELSGAVELLALAYWSKGDQQRLGELLERGPRFVPPSGNGFIAELDDTPAYLPATGSEPVALRGNFRLALLKGDIEAARRHALAWLRVAQPHAHPAGAARAPDAPDPQALVGRLLSGLQVGLAGPQLVGLNRKFDELRQRFGTPYQPLSQKLSQLTDAQIIADVKRDLRQFTTQSFVPCDALLYLIEQRNYQGVDLPAGDLIWMAFYIEDVYGSARAVPVYLLCQKSGVLNPRQQYDVWNAAEIGYYLTSALISDRRAILDSAYPHYLEAIDQAIEISEHPDAPQLARNIRLILWLSRWRLDQFTGRLHLNVPVFQRLIEESDSPGVRHYARLYLAQHHMDKTRDYARARELLEQMAAGADGQVYAHMGLYQLLNLASRSKDAALWEQTKQRVRDGLADAPPGSQQQRNYETMLARERKF